MRWTITLASLAQLLLLGAACGRVFEYPVASSENNAKSCADGIDNDLDGLADCYDSECAKFCQENTAEACTDGLDNDVDGKIDCKDDDCAAFCQEHTAKACSDGLDNDGDGKIDCKDDDCAAFCQETGAAACSNHQDDDHDGLVDCADPDCDGFCPEESAADCADGRDNDGDGLIDAADPRCWLITPPNVQRCASADINFQERFDDPSSTDGTSFTFPRWFQFGEFHSYRGHLLPIVAPFHHGTRTSPYALTGRADIAALFAFNTTNADSLAQNLGGIVSDQLFTGQWANLELSFSVKVPQGSALRLALVPKALARTGEAPLATASDAVLSVTLDGSSNPPTFELDVGGSGVSSLLPFPPFEACGLYPCDRWSTVRVGFDAGALTAVLEGAAGKTSLTSAPLGTPGIPESKLVVWGGSVDPTVMSGIDDLIVSNHSPSACGFETPQIPAASCDYSQQFASAGQAVAVARRKAGDYCALVAGAERAGTLGADNITAWTSADGKAWAPAHAGAARPAFAVPDGAVPVGVGLADDGKALFAAVVLKDAHGAHLGLSRAAKCSAFSELTAGPALPDDAEGPSYLLTNGRHEVYFTRPPTSDTGRTLWRVSGPDQGGLELEAALLAELPSEARANAPVSISRVGARDLVLTYPTQPDVGASGLGMLIGEPDGRSWQALPTLPVLTGEAGGFDADGVLAGALSFDSAEGLLLYGGTLAGSVATGVARVLPAGAQLPETMADACGDGNCTFGETCASCPSDCPCPGKLLAEGGFSDKKERWVMTSRGGLPDGPYLDPNTASLILPPTDGAWAVLPLEHAINGDFELGFDVSVPNVNTGSAVGATDSLFIGVGAKPELDASYPIGVFARFTALPALFGDGSCLGGDGSYLLSPYAATEARAQSTLKWFSTDCGQSRLLVPFDTTHHVVLTRRAGVVSVGVFDADGCGQTVSLTQKLALPALPSILAGGFGASYFNTSNGAELSHLTLRLLDDPQTCAPGQVLCGDADEEPTCVDTDATPEHCGACGVACKPGAVCEKGSCACPKGLLDCDDECADQAQSSSNCGKCGNACDKYCLVGECDAGKSCAEPKVLPSGAGTYPFDLWLAQEDNPLWCGYRPLIGGKDLRFQWTPDRSGTATLRLRGVLRVVDTLLSVTTDPTCQTFADAICNDDEPTPLGVTGIGALATFPVEKGTSYYITATLANYSQYLDEPPGPVELTLEVQ